MSETTPTAPIPLEPIHSCATCTKPAKQLCSACKNHPDPHGMIESVCYCSTTCQTTHWKEQHKKECKFRQDRLVLFRIGDTLQKLFYVYRENVFNKFILRVEKRKGTLYTYEGFTGNERTGVDFVYEFPAELFEDENDRLGALVQSASGDAVAWFYEVIPYLLADLIVNTDADKNPSGLEEMGFIPKNIKRHIISMDNASNGELQNGQRDRAHFIIRLNMKDWTGFALDLTGAQYGWLEPVVNLKDYMDEKMEIQSVGLAKFGTLRERVLEMSTEGKENINSVTLNNLRISRILKKEVITWQVKEGNMMVRDMCRLDHQKFERKQKEFLGYMEKKLRERVEEERQEYFDAFEGAGGKPDPEDGDGGLEEPIRGA